MDEVPQDLSAEMAVLGSMALDPKCIPEVMAVLTEKSFHDERHATMFGILASGYREYGERADGALLASRLLAVDASLIDLWEQMAGSVPSPTNFAYYARLVLLAAAARAVVMEARQIDHAAKKGEWTADTQEFIDKFANKVARVSRHLASRLSGKGSAAQEVNATLDAAIAGGVRSVKWTGFNAIHFTTNALQPGTITMLCGDPGAGKSMIAAEALMNMHNAGESVAMLQLESGRAMHLLRMLAMRVGESQLDDPEWVRRNADRVRKIQADNAEWLSEFGTCCHEIAEGEATYDQVAAWVHSQAQAGVRVLLVDPITSAAPSDKPWIADKELLGDLRSAVSKHGASLIVVIHPKMGDHAKEMAGGAAWKRHVDTVLWLTAMEPETLTLLGDDGSFKTECNRVLTVKKARRGKGAGRKIGLFFDSMTLRTNEFGMVVEDSE